MQIKGPTFPRIGIVMPYITRIKTLGVHLTWKNMPSGNIHYFQRYHFFLFYLSILALGHLISHCELQCTTLCVKKIFHISLYTMHMHVRLKEVKEYILKYPFKPIFHEIEQYSNIPSNDCKQIANCIHITPFCTDSCCMCCKSTIMWNLWNAFVPTIMIVYPWDWPKANFTTYQIILGGIVSASNEFPIIPKHLNALLVHCHDLHVQATMSTFWHVKQRNRVHESSFCTQASSSGS